MNVAAKQTIAIVYTQDVCARFHPNSLSSGRTNTLHAYNEPSARFRDMPPMIGSHRVMGHLFVCAPTEGAAHSRPGYCLCQGIRRAISCSLFGEPLRRAGNRF